MKPEISALIEKAKEYYSTNNFKIPNSVVEYIAKFPPGLSRQMLKDKYGILCSEFVKMLNPSYSKPLSAAERALVECSRLGYTLITDTTLLHNSRDKVSIECIECKTIHTTTITSLAGSKLGCPKCKSGNLPWHKRQEELDSIILSRLNGLRVSSIPRSQSGFITIKHLECNTEYTTQLLGVVSPNSKLRATCPNCRPSDRRVTYNGITFGSEFEYQCYKLLEPLNPEVQVAYAKYIDTNRRWVCDFKIASYWIEVSNFKVDYKGYFSNIEEKRVAVESAGYMFFFVTSIEELKELISLM